MEQWQEFKTLHETAVSKRLQADPGLKIESMTPISCPVMMEIVIDGSPATFRARGSWWGMYVGHPEAKDEFNNEHEQVFRLEAYYEEGAAAGYIPLETFLLVVEQGIAAFRAMRPFMPSDFRMKPDQSSSS